MGAPVPDTPCMLLVNHPAQCHECADRPTCLHSCLILQQSSLTPASSPPPPPLGSTAGPACQHVNTYCKLVAQCHVTAMAGTGCRRREQAQVYACRHNAGTMATKVCYTIWCLYQLTILFIAPQLSLEYANCQFAFGSTFGLSSMDPMCAYCR